MKERKKERKKEREFVGRKTKLKMGERIQSDQDESADWSWEKNKEIKRAKKIFNSVVYLIISMKELLCLISMRWFI